MAGEEHTCRDVCIHSHHGELSPFILPEGGLQYKQGSFIAMSDLRR